MKALFLGMICLAGFGVAQAQQTNFLNCSGANDTAEFNRVIANAGAAPTTLRIPAPNGARCAVAESTIPANITLDNTDGIGITLKKGATLTILGNIINPSGKQIFFNALPGQGTVSFRGNRYISILNPEWWGAKTSGDDARGKRRMHRGG